MVYNMHRILAKSPSMKGIFPSLKMDNPSGNTACRLFQKNGPPLTQDLDELSVCIGLKIGTGYANLLLCLAIAC